MCTYLHVLSHLSVLWAVLPKALWLFGYETERRHK